VGYSGVKGVIRGIYSRIRRRGENDNDGLHLPSREIEELHSPRRNKIRKKRGLAFEHVEAIHSEKKVALHGPLQFTLNSPQKVAKPAE